MGQPSVGILIFDGVDELDFVGPLDVFSYAAGWAEDRKEIAVIGSDLGECRGVNGLTFRPGYCFDSAPKLDVIIIPGGYGTADVARDQTVLKWLQQAALNATWVCSVCTGSFVLEAAGLTKGRRITTHSGMIEALRAISSGKVVEHERYVVDGNVVTAAGVSAGIDMALWVVGQIYGKDHSRTVRANLEYNPSPPF